MGRTGRLWAHEHAGVAPDIMTLAKGLANGVPVGAMLTREEIARSLTPGSHGSTFGGTPFVASVALATLTTMLEERIPERVSRVGRHLAEALRGLGSRHAIRDVRGKGLLLGVELDRAAGPLVDACRDEGLLALTAGDKVLRLAPPLIASEADCDRAVGIIDRVLARPAA
jgi:acetylornithine/succinyldiaminopimelate/putrescine aminotransferase